MNHVSVLLFLSERPVQEIDLFDQQTKVIIPVIGREEGRESRSRSEWQYTAFSNSRKNTITL